MSFVIQRVVGRQISLSEVRANVLRIGRGTNAELRSDNPAVALEHAVVEHDSAGYSITDKGSITGTYVNGKPVETARLSKGDVIEIGDLKVDVQVADPAKPLFLRIVTKPKRAVSQAAPIVEEDEPPVAAAPGGSLPVRAPRVDYAAAFRLHRVYLTKLSLAAIGLIVALIVISEVTKPEKQKAFMPGGVSSAHARARDAKGEVIANDCDACHAPWRSVQDRRCITCHARIVHSETETGTPPCMSCHTEHRGLPKLALINDQKCSSCHADLPLNMKAEARAKGSGDPRYPIQLLRKITAFGVDHPEIVAPTDPNNLLFNHKLHLKKGGIFNGEGKREELACLGCHGLVVKQGKSDPVALNFEQHCERCHKLTFDQQFPTAQVPHAGDPQLVYGFITSTYAGNRDILGKTPDEVRRLLSRRAVVAAGDRAFFAAEQVVKSKCGKCHDLRKVADRWVVQAPVIRTAWLPGAKFSHTAGPHRGDCESCHRGLRASVATSDVHMPRREDCTTCHGAGANATASSCVTCHEYHVRSKPLLASSTVPLAGGATSELGGDPRMIDNILLIAIALLLVVVFVPVGIALYQRLKPRTDDRPIAAAQPRPAPPAMSPAAPAPVAPAPQRAAAPPAPAVAPAAAAPVAGMPARPDVAGSDATRMGDVVPKTGGATEFVQWNGMLLCTGGPLEGQRFVIEEQGLYIGRDAALAEVVINDSRISKRHVRVVPRDGKVVAIDQNSTNGTFMGSAPGARISEVQLKRGDTLVLADNAATFIYQI